MATHHEVSSNTSAQATQEASLQTYKHRQLKDRRHAVHEKGCPLIMHRQHRIKTC